MTKRKINQLTYKDAVLAMAQKVRNNLYHMKSNSLKNDVDKVEHHKNKALSYLTATTDLLKEVDQDYAGSPDESEILDLMIKVETLENKVSELQIDADKYREMQRIMGK